MAVPIAVTFLLTIGPRIGYCFSINPMERPMSIPAYTVINSPGRTAVSVMRHPDLRGLTTPDVELLDTPSHTH